MTVTTPIPNPRVGTREESRDLLRLILNRAGVEVSPCVICGAETRHRFGVAPLCDDHKAEAMATAYAMETGGAY